MSSMKARKYAIKAGQPYFKVGKLTDGRQVLMGIVWPDILALFFSSAGEMQEVIARPIPLGIPNPLDDRVDRALCDWAQELGLSQTSIRVSRFFLPDKQVGIADLPLHYAEFLEHKEAYTPARRLELQSDIDTWNKSGDFVLYWCVDYYVDRTGEVISS